MIAQPSPASAPDRFTNLRPAAPPATPRSAPRPEGAPPPRLRPLGEQVAELEREAIRTALMATGGNRVATARLLRMSRAALYERLARWPELAGGR